MSNKNVQTAHTYLEQAWNGRDEALIDDLFAEDCVVHNLPSHLPSGQAGIRKNLARILGTFPDFAVAVEDTIQETGSLKPKDPVSILCRKVAL